MQTPDLKTLHEHNVTMEIIKVILSMVGIPLLAWVLITLYDFNAQVYRLSEVAVQLTARLAETNAAMVTHAEFEAHNQRLNQERAGINIRLSKHDDQIRALEMRRSK